MNFRKISHICDIVLELFCAGLRFKARILKNTRKKWYFYHTCPHNFDNRLQYPFTRDISQVYRYILYLCGEDYKKSITVNRAVYLKGNKRFWEGSPLYILL